MSSQGRRFLILDPRETGSQNRVPGHRNILVHGRFDQGLRGLNSVDQFTETKESVNQDSVYCSSGGLPLDKENR